MAEFDNPLYDDDYDDYDDDNNDYDETSLPITHEAQRTRDNQEENLQHTTGTDFSEAKKKFVGLILNQYIDLISENFVLSHPIALNPADFDIKENISDDFH